MEPQPLRLESLTIRRFRHLREPAHLELGEGPILLVGRNGTGKTNLLRLIDAVTRLDFRELEQDPKGLDLEMAFRWGELRLKLALSCEPSREMGSVSWRYSGTLADDQHSVTFRVGDGAVEPPRTGAPFEVPRPSDRNFRRNLAYFLSSPSQVDAWVRPVAGSPFALLSGATGRYDEALGAFSALTIVDAEDRASLNIHDFPDPLPNYGLLSFCPRQLASLLSRRPREERQSLVTGEEFPPLRTAARVCGFQELACAAQIDREEPMGGGWATTYGPFLFRARLADGTVIPHHDFSFGQKRIVAFFWYLACIREASGAVVADELVNGMHHAAVRELVDAMAGLQAFLASQNPLLFDYMSYASPLEFQRRLILCEAGSSGWKWRSPTQKESERFFEAHDVGYQHVHEILRDEGLW
jgi:hypothetical protein